MTPRDEHEGHFDDTEKPHEHHDGHLDEHEGHFDDTEKPHEHRDGHLDEQEGHFDDAAMAHTRDVPRDAGPESSAPSGQYDDTDQ